MVFCVGGSDNQWVWSSVPPLGIEQTDGYFWMWGCLVLAPSQLQGFSPLHNQLTQSNLGAEGLPPCTVGADLALSTCYCTE